MSMKEMLEKAKQIYIMDDFRAFMRQAQGLSDEDFNEPITVIKEFILGSKEHDPSKMFFSLFDQIEGVWKCDVPIPVNNEWHHFIIPGIVLSCMRNCGYGITQKDIEEGMTRGQRFTGGSCGFMGTCGGAYSVGIVASIINKTTPLHDEERTKIMPVVADTLVAISQIGRRCCKRSSYIAIESAVKYLSTQGYTLPLAELECRFWSKNKMCAGVVCPYHPKASSRRNDENDLARL